MPTYTPAEFKTAHERLGVSTAFIAAHARVTVGTIWDYESPKRKNYVPQRAADVMAALEKGFDTAVDRVAAKGQKAGIIQRPVDVAKFYKQHPMVEGFGPTAVGLIIAAAQQRVHVPVEYI